MANADATITSSCARRGPVTDVQIGRDGVYRYKGPETDVQTLRSPAYATADVRLHFFAAE